MKTHCVIGDVHGEYQMLLNLVAKLPADTKLIFVGDLINRGSQSREVVKFVRENGHQMVTGNHELYLLKHARVLISAMSREHKIPMSHIWVYKYCASTFRSYGLLEENSFEIIKNYEGLERLKDDLQWLITRPTYIEMGEVENYPLPMVISHGSIGDYWHLRNSDREAFELHKFNRREPSDLSPIFNIYGHQSVKEVVVGENFINLDTGCGKYLDSKLSAYCIETGEFFEVDKYEYVEEMVA